MSTEPQLGEKGGGEGFPCLAEKGGGRAGAGNGGGRGGGRGGAAARGECLTT